MAICDLTSADISVCNGLRIVQNPAVPVGHFYSMGSDVYACHPDTYRELDERSKVKSAAGESSPGNSSLERARDPNWGMF